MLGNNKALDEEINLEIISWNEDPYLNDSITYFEELQVSVAEIGINLTYKMESHHDRFIAADSGWKITLGRGLDLFKKIEGRFNVADMDQTKRKCKACEKTYLKI
jgi:ATP-dependent Lon protease